MILVLERERVDTDFFLGYRVIEKEVLVRFRPLFPIGDRGAMVALPLDTNIVRRRIDARDRSFRFNVYSELDGFECVPRKPLRPQRVAVLR